MVHTLRFDELVWNEQAMFLPHINKNYLLTQVKLVQADSEELNDFPKIYGLYVNRSMELLCYLRVHESDTHGLKTLQNFLLKSRIKRFGSH